MYEISPEARAIRSAQARAAGLQSAAMRDGKSQGLLGHAGHLKRFYAQVDAAFPDLEPAEREKKVQLLVKAQMVRVRAERTRKEFRAKARAAAPSN